MTDEDKFAPWRRVIAAQANQADYLRRLRRALLSVLDRGWTFKGHDTLEKDGVCFTARADRRWNVGAKDVPNGSRWGCEGPFEPLESIRDDVREELVRTMDRAKKLGKTLMTLNALVARFDDGGKT